MVLRTLWQRLERSRAKNSAYGKQYLEYGYEKTSWAFMQAFPCDVMHRVVDLYEGFRMLSLCRTGGLWTGKKVVGAYDKEGVNEFRHKCFCCERKVKGPKRDGSEEGGAETIRHLIVECSRWSEERDNHIGQILEDVKGMERLLDKRVVLLFGGECNGHKLEGWLPSRRGQSSETIGGEMTECVAFKVAAFFREIANTRHAMLSRLELELSPHDSPLKSQSPMGRVSLERQDFG